MKSAEGWVAAAALALIGARHLALWPQALDKALAALWLAFGAAAILYMWGWERR